MNQEERPERHSMGSSGGFEGDGVGGQEASGGVPELNRWRRKGAKEKGHFWQRDRVYSTSLRDQGWREMKLLGGQGQDLKGFGDCPEGSSLSHTRTRPCKGFGGWHGAEGETVDQGDQLEGLGCSP